ncbi:armadillo-type protein [Fimicolochytrium jonesii]|uniref:armadillo-type protein n=1 Tax=Fimicolochytrium jonesii TaxID=1396493 RepID=UPI0022FE448F|nr:armadillo-type protein [Fimicolochytrium jonesii]KAI8822570.1 armadillo-type protein [Fimicolochytrium jonesii]
MLADATVGVPVRPATAEDNMDDDCPEQFRSFFPETDEVKQSLAQLVGILEQLNRDIEALSTQSDDWKPHIPDITNEDQLKFNKVQLICGKYQEQPHLLDPHLEDLVQPLMENLSVILSSVHDFDSAKRKDLAVQIKPVLAPFLSFMYCLTKVRGYKTVVKLFSHKVVDLEPVAFYLEVMMEHEDASFWEGRYVLLLWLSLLSMVPFDLRTIDSGSGGGGLQLVERILNIAKHYLYAVGKEYEGAALLMMRIITRKDTAPEHLTKFVLWATEQIQGSENVFNFRGLLLALCAIFEGGRRELLLPAVDAVLPCCALIDDPFVQNNALLRKLLMKLTQRVGLALMRPRTAKWRYDRGSRSLEVNLAQIGSESKNGVESCDTPDDDDDDDFVPESMETIVGILLNGLRDKDTIVRWSAAKGVGRIMERLPKDLGQDIAASVIALLSEDILPGYDGSTYDLSQVSDSTWHGSCLALAELSRRGLLLPDKLEEVVPWLLLALKFDLRRGTHSVGAHVRDAACYVCWSFARAYAPGVIKPFVHKLAEALVVVSLCDREINIRRAASAAFQENVGRQGLFPHGIAIVTAADYFAVGNRSNAFLHLAVEIAKFPEYFKSISAHIANVSLRHWDKPMRELAAEALARLVPINPRYIQSEVLPSLVAHIASPELDVRHGSLLAVGQICLAQYKCVPVADGSPGWWNTEGCEAMTKSIADCLSSYPSQYLDGFGSEQTRMGCCQLIGCLAEAEWPPIVQKSPALIDSCWRIVTGSLEQRVQPGQLAAARAVSELNRCASMDVATLDAYLAGISPLGNKFRRQGYSLALGELTGFVLRTHVARIVDALLEASNIQPEKTHDDAESKRNAIQALTSICVNLGSELPTVISHAKYQEILRGLINGMHDYSTDSRGDVGSWVRQACILAFQQMVPLAVQYPTAISDGRAYISPEMGHQIMGEICQQSVEKIDRMRECAGNALLYLLWKVPSFDFTGRDELRSYIPEETTVSWSTGAEVYPIMTNALRAATFRVRILSGLVLSIGGLSESLVRHSGSSFVSFAASLSEQAIDTSGTGPEMTIPDLFSALLQVFKTYHRQDRVSISILETIDLLFGCGAFARYTSGEAYFKELLALTKKEVFKSRDVKKLLAGIKVLCGFASLRGIEGPLMPEIKTTALSQLILYLVHPFPKIRSAVAEQLYLTISAEEPVDFVEGEELPDEMEDTEDAERGRRADAEDILLSTDW